MTETPTSTPVILTNEQQPVLENSKPKPSPTAPKWEIVARERMRAAIKKFGKPLTDLVARDANEGDTRTQAHYLFRLHSQHRSRPARNRNSSGHIVAHSLFLNQLKHILFTASSSAETS
jgi:hypothetical protein